MKPGQLVCPNASAGINNPNAKSAFRRVRFIWLSLMERPVRWGKQGKTSPQQYGFPNIVEATAKPPAHLCESARNVGLFQRDYRRPPE